MDRNIAITYIKTDITVALRKESVDRNLAVWAIEHAYQLSLSARRAWIEINMLCSAVKSWVVALRKESVDRNPERLSNALKHLRSLSARRAWIEILASGINPDQSGSLSARRAWIEMHQSQTQKPRKKRRSPQGERG